MKSTINMSQQLSKSRKSRWFHPINEILVRNTFNRVDIFGVGLVRILSGILVGIIVLVIGIRTGIVVAFASRVTRGTWGRSILHDPREKTCWLLKEILVSFSGNIGSIQIVIVRSDFTVDVDNIYIQRNDQNIIIINCLT